MVAKGIRGGICHPIYKKSKVYGWIMSRKLPINNFEWIEDNSQFNEHFIKNYDEKSDEGYFLEVDIQYPEKNYMTFTMIYHFYLKE